MDSTFTPLEKECYEGLTFHLLAGVPPLSSLRNHLLSFKKAGLDKPAMELLLFALRKELPTREDTILDLLDFVTGFCRQDLAIFQVDASE